MKPFVALYALIKRDLIRFVRQRSRLIGAMLTPLLIWFLLGSGLGNSFQDPSYAASGGGYLHYFFPGMLALSVLFTAIFSTITVIEDRHEGFLQGVLVSPTPRWVFLWAKLLSGAILGAVQGLILVAIAPFVGISFSFIVLFEVFFILLLAAMALTALGFYLAWKIDSVAGYHSMMNMLLMPLWLLSGAVFPLENRGSFFELIRKVNPLGYAMRSLRALIFDGHDSHLLFNMGILGLFLLILVGLTQQMLQQSQK